MHSQPLVYSDRRSPMAEPTVPNKVKVTILLDDTQWRRFRQACLGHRVSASNMIGAYIAQQLQEWRMEGRINKQTHL